MHRRALLACPVALSACSPARTLSALALGAANAATPADGTLREVGLPYGPHPRQRMDVYAPQDAAGAPVAVFWYGGGWVAGDRGDYRFIGQALAGLGLVACIADYRLHPEVRWPAFAEDGALALRAARDAAPRLGGDPHRLVALGHSAGGHTALVLALDPRYLAAVDMAPRDLSGLVALAPPTGLEPYRGRNLPAIFGIGKDAQRPIHLARAADAPPALLLAGEADTIIRAQHVTALAAALRAAGNQAEARVVPGEGHLGLLRGLAPALPGGGALLPALRDFTHHPSRQGPEA